MRSSVSGSIFFEVKEITHQSIAVIKKLGVACVPEDPLRQGAVPPISVEGNLALNDVSNTQDRDWKPMNWASARRRASWFTEQFGLKMPRLNVAIQALSGGNIQRIVFARELSEPAKLLLAYYPTRGLDIHAAEVIRLAILNYRDQGAAILLISEDLDELLLGLLMALMSAVVVAQDATAAVVSPDDPCGPTGTEAVATALAESTGKDLSTYTGKIGFIFVGPVDDFGYNYAANQGCLCLEAVLPNIETIFA